MKTQGKIPSYIALMAELVSTLECMEQFPIPPYIKERMQQRQAELKGIRIEHICPHTICQELKKAKEVHDQTKHLLYV